MAGLCCQWNQCRLFLPVCDPSTATLIPFQHTPDDSPWVTPAWQGICSWRYEQPPWVLTHTETWSGNICQKWGRKEEGGSKATWSSCEASIWGQKVENGREGTWWKVSWQNKDEQRKQWVYFPKPHVKWLLGGHGPCWLYVKLTIALSASRRRQHWCCPREWWLQQQRWWLQLLWWRRLHSQCEPHCHSQWHKGWHHGSLRGTGHAATARRPGDNVPGDFEAAWGWQGVRTGIATKYQLSQQHEQDRARC